MGGDDREKQTYRACNGIFLTSLGNQSEKIKTAEPYHILLEWSFNWWDECQENPLTKELQEKELIALSHLYTAP